MRRFLILVCLFLIPDTAQAQNNSASSSVYLEDLTWPEVKARLKTGTNTIIIPSGGTEQNGPYLIIGKHNRIVYYTAGEIARTLSNALVAPVISYVPEGPISPTGHMAFPGTITLREEAFALLLEDAARSFKQHGFTRICFLGDSGGNQNMQNQIATKLGAEWQKEGIIVMNVSDYYEDKEAITWAKSEHLGGNDPAAHAGFMDTSELMAIDANGLRTKTLKPDVSNDIAPMGAMGDASQANIEYGKKLLQFKIKAAVEQIKQTEAEIR